jgi:flagellar protein FliO/FliZ
VDVTTVLRVAFSLAVVFGLLWLSYRIAGRGSRSSSGGPGEQLTVVARQGLTQKSTAVLLEAGGKRYLLGVTEGSVTVIDGPAPRSAEPAPAASAQPLPAAPSRTPAHEAPESFDDIVTAAERWLAEEADRPNPWPELPPRHEAPTRAARNGAQGAATTGDRPGPGAGQSALETFLARDTWRRAAQAVLGPRR